MATVAAKEIINKFSLYSTYNLFHKIIKSTTGQAYACLTNDLLEKHSIETICSWPRQFSNNEKNINMQ